jgi:hypothetical protein
VPNTDSETAILDTIRTALLNWAPLSHPATGTATLGELLGADQVESDGDLDEAAMYLDAPPEDAAFPYAILRMVTLAPLGDDSRYQYRGIAEVQFHGWPRSETKDFAGMEIQVGTAMSAMADLVDQCWRDYAHLAVDDTLRSQGVNARTTSPNTEPPNRERVVITMLLAFFATPFFQAQYSTGPRL